MTTELFKQWKRDELPHLQDYYIKNNLGQTVIARNYKYQNNKLNVLFAVDSFMYKNHRRESLRCVDILSPVPSYPEMKKLLQQAVKYRNLLKEAAAYLNPDIKGSSKVIRKINEVLK